MKYAIVMGSSNTSELLMVVRREDMSATWTSSMGTHQISSPRYHGKRIPSQPDQISKYALLGAKRQIFRGIR